MAPQCWGVSPPVLCTTHQLGQVPDPGSGQCPFSVLPVLLALWSIGICLILRQISTFSLEQGKERWSCGTMVMHDCREIKVKGELRSVRETLGT